MAPKGQSTRPTADRARQAIFGVLEHAAFGRPFAGLAAADLFAGSGALGLEALSRGARSCLFVDRNPAAVAAIRHNLARLALSDRAEVLAGAVERFGPGAPFDLVFLDPPYRQGLLAPALAALVGERRLAEGAIVIAERAAGEPAPGADGLILLEDRRWGAASVAFLRAAPNPLP